MEHAPRETTVHLSLCRCGTVQLQLGRTVYSFDPEDFLQLARGVDNAVTRLFEQGHLELSLAPERQVH